MTTWTRTPPTKPGWYWWRDSQTQFSYVVLLMPRKSGGLVADSAFWMSPKLVKHISGEWSDQPIAEPVEP